MGRRWWEDLAAWADGHGIGVAVGHPEALAAVRGDLTLRRSRGEFHPLFVERIVQYFVDASAERQTGLPRVKALAVLSVPSAARRVVFDLTEGPITTVLPPGHSTRPDLLPGELRKELASGPLAGHQFAFIIVSQKNLAARLGLVTYGRNNVTYGPGTGSYHRLITIAVADALGKDAISRAFRSGSDPRLAPECEGCEVCLKACPTGAIGSDRFLLHPEHCITWFNEKAGEFPEWVLASTHNCLVGCFLCQVACPKNRGMLRFDEPDLVCTAQESAAIYAMDPNPPESAMAKFAAAGAGYELRLFGRNLRTIVAAKRKAAGQVGG